MGVVCGKRWPDRITVVEAMRSIKNRDSVANSKNEMCQLGQPELSKTIGHRSTQLERRVLGKWLSVMVIVSADLRANGLTEASV